MEGSASAVDVSSSQTESLTGFLAAYPDARAASEAAARDEMVEADGALRPHWQMLVAMLDSLGRAELNRRWEQARRLIHNNGVSHNVYGDPHGLDRPWNLDSVPLLLPAEQWQAVCEALAQRARLLNLVLADIYGPARCVFEGVLPAELVWGNPAFLRACTGLEVPERCWLPLYAADVIRTAEGQFEVLSDRTQAPSGAGYCLENRIVLSRVLPEEYRQSNVCRLAPFFVQMRETLAALAPGNPQQPRVVVLTPGPYNETYFEQAYLARYLGYQLVQGNDLTVRDGRVYLKTLSGLQRIHVIVRRVDDHFCDPVELYQRSYLGVPGLLQAVRSGTVTVANGLGSGALQCPGILPYLPALCRFFLSEELQLPSVNTWWCGDPEARGYVLENLSDLVIKHALPTAGGEPVFVNRLDAARRKDLAHAISAHPERFVAQRQVMDCTTPAMVDGKLQPRRFVMRAFLSAAGTSGEYFAMQGALTRVTGSGDPRNVSLQHGAGSKDTWILSSSPVPDVTLLNNAAQPIPITRGGNDLPSRIADDLYWLGRYVERLDGLARLARGTLTQLLDQPTQASRAAIDTLVRCIHPMTLGESAFDNEQAIARAIFDASSQASLPAHARSTNRLSRALRDQLSADANRALQSLCAAALSSGAETATASATIDLLDTLVGFGAAFAGLVTDSITRGQSFSFLDAGRRIERALSTTQFLLDTLATAPADQSLLEAVLEITDSSVTYRRRYLAQLEAHAVADLLLTDPTNPRAVLFQLNQVHEHLGRLPRPPLNAVLHPDMAAARSVVAKLEALDVASLAGPGAPGEFPGDTMNSLAGSLRELLGDIANLSATIGTMYFTHSSLQQGLPGQPTIPPPEPSYRREENA